MNSNARFRAIKLVVFAPTTLAASNIAGIGNELDSLDVLDHHEAELRLNAQTQRRTVCDGQRLAIYVISQNRLRVAKKINMYRAIKMVTSVRMRLGMRLVVKRVKAGNFASGCGRSPQLV